MNPPSLNMKKLIGHMKKVLPSGLRSRLRLCFDSFFIRSHEGTRRIGGQCQWTVVASRLKPGTNVLSGGAGHDVSFELELAGSCGCNVALFDPSPTGCETMKKVGVLPAGLHFFPKGFAESSGLVSFSRPESVEEGSFRSVCGAGRVDDIRFECLSYVDALSAAGMHEVELLKIDIEGFEYGFIDGVLESGVLPKQIAVEFHHFLPNISFSKTFRTIRNLRAAGYVLLYKKQCDMLFLHKSAF
jgi:FkbM family methyltransferase